MIQRLSRAPARRWARLAQRVPDAVWAPLTAGGLLLLVGLIGRAAGLPLIFASLGPTLLLLALKPADTSCRFYNVLAGHALGLGAGFLALWLTTAHAAAPASVDQPLPGPRLAAAAIALAVTVLGQVLCRASHAPGAATTLLFALGTLPPTWRAAALLLSATALVAVLGEAPRRARAGPDPAGPLPRVPGEA